MAKPSTPLVLRLKYTKFPTFSAVDTRGTAHRQPGRYRQVPESSHDFLTRRKTAPLPPPFFLVEEEGERSIGNHGVP